jgi:hypothetical protein
MPQTAPNGILVGTIMAQKLVLSIGLAGLSVLALLMTTPARGDDDDCAEPMANWQPREVVRQMAQTHGWTIRRIKIDEGCYRLDARDTAGKRVLVRVNPATLAILEIETDLD